MDTKFLVRADDSKCDVPEKNDDDDSRYQGSGISHTSHQEEGKKWKFDVKPERLMIPPAGYLFRGIGNFKDHVLPDSPPVIQNQSNHPTRHDSVP
jgi:hypothetical protein